MVSGRKSAGFLYRCMTTASQFSRFSNKYLRWADHDRQGNTCEAVSPYLTRQAIVAALTGSSCQSLWPRRNEHMPAPTPVQPDYACAIITRPDGWFLLQLRPNWARQAPGQLTCFGGARAPREDDYACLVRELWEELGWSPTTYQAACELRRGEHLIARFFRCPMPAAQPLRTEPDQVPVWAPAAAFPGLPVSPWHATVLAAVARGETVVDLPA